MAGKTIRKCISALIFAVAACAQPISEPAKTGLACIADMPIPGYIQLLWFARVAGEVKTVITIGPDGSSSSLDVKSTQKLLGDHVRHWMSKARFLKNCAGETLEMTFVYRLAGDPHKEPTNDVQYKGSNTFQMTSRPPIAETHANTPLP